MSDVRNPGIGNGNALDFLVWEYATTLYWLGRERGGGPRYDFWIGERDRLARRLDAAIDAVMGRIGPGCPIVLDEELNR